MVDNTSHGRKNIVGEFLKCEFCKKKFSVYAQWAAHSGSLKCNNCLNKKISNSTGIFKPNFSTIYSRKCKKCYNPFKQLVSQRSCVDSFCKYCVDNKYEIKNFTHYDKSLTDFTYFAGSTTQPGVRVSDTNFKLQDLNIQKLRKISGNIVPIFDQLKNFLTCCLCNKQFSSCASFSVSVGRIWCYDCCKKDVNYMREFNEQHKSINIFKYNDINCSVMEQAVDFSELVDPVDGSKVITCVSNNKRCVINSTYPTKDIHNGGIDPIWTVTVPTPGLSTSPWQTSKPSETTNKVITQEYSITTKGNANEGSSHSKATVNYKCDFCFKIENVDKGLIVFKNKIKCLPCTNKHRQKIFGEIQCDYCQVHFNVYNTFQAAGGLIKCFKCVLFHEYNICQGMNGLVANTPQSYKHDIQCGCLNPNCSFNVPSDLVSNQCNCIAPVCLYDLSNVTIKNTTGFVPHGTLAEWGGPYNIVANFDYLQLCKHLKNHKHNCTGARIVVPTKLNLPLWQFYLANYWDHQLIAFLHCGFPLNTRPDAYIKSGPITNHSSAVKFSTHIDHYLETEQAHRAILGPYSEPPLQGMHFSPMLTRPKQGSNKRRVIVDLSWPLDASINSAVAADSYMGTPFSLKFPTVDDIAERIVSLQGNCVLYKVDLQRAFRQLKLDPKDIINTGLFHNELHYVDVSVPFGYRHGSMACQRFTDAIRYIMHKHGFTIFNYIDDLIGCEKPHQANASFQFLLKLLHTLGVPISIDKLYYPQSEVQCLGIDINTSSGSMQIPAPKMATIYEQCLQWYSKVSATRNQLQSLLGTLLYVHKCVKPARIFVNRILCVLRSAPSKGYIPLTVEFHRDIRWFLTFLHHFNGRVIFDKIRAAPVHTLFLDACLSGMGGCCGAWVYHCVIPPYLILDPTLFIVHLEMLNILVALRLWSKQLACTSVLIYCDNIAAVTVCQTGRTQDTFLAAAVRNIWLTLATNDISAHFTHITGKNNIVADVLSRWHLPRAPKHKLFQHIPYPIWHHVTPELCLVDYNI